MAINFPSTVGQPTNGSYTYTVAGISYSWNGESWVAAGAGATTSQPGWIWRPLCAILSHWLVRAASEPVLEPELVICPFLD